MTTGSWAEEGRILIITLLGLMAMMTVGQAAEQRSWTNQDGRTIQAAFVRLDDDMVVMRFQGNEVSVPLNSLSEADQQYVESQQDAGGSPADAVSERLASKRALERTRQWTDQSGNSTNGKFIRVHQGNLVLRRGNIVRALPFDEFSDEDQAFVKEHLEKAGEEQMLADLEAARLKKLAAEEARRRSAEAGGSSMSSASPMTRFPSMPRIPTMPRMPEMPTTPRMPAMPNTPQMPGSSTMDRGASAVDGIAEQIRRSQQASQDLRERLAQQRRESAEQIEEQIRQSQQATHEMIVNSRPQFVTEMEEVMVCFNCDNEVPLDTKPGDTCPHCHKRFLYEVDEQGNRTYANGNVVSAGNMKVGLIILSVTLLLALIGGVGCVVAWIAFR